MRAVKPLGIFGVVASQPQFAQVRDELVSLRGLVPEASRAHVARYLREGTVVLAIMEYSQDIIGGLFGTSGGSGLVTDGTFYWRRDAAEYVEHYGIGLLDEFIRHGDRLHWAPQLIDSEDVTSIDAYLIKFARRIPTE